MYDFSNFIRMSETFPRNFDKNSTSKIQSHFMTKKAKMLRFQLAIYFSPVILTMYYVWSRKSHRYYQIYPQKTVQTYMPDYVQDDVVRKEVTLNNTMPYNQL